MARTRRRYKSVAARAYLLIGVRSVLAVTILWCACTPHGLLAQGTPVAGRPPTCAELQEMIATPVTSPTIAQSTAGMHRANLSLAVETLVACRNDQTWPAYIGMFEQTWLAATYGSSNGEEVAAMLEGLYQSGYLLPLQLIAAGEPVVTGRTATVVVTTREGNVLRRDEWRFVNSEERWLFSGSKPLEPLLDVNAVGIPLTLTASGLTATRDQVFNPGAVMLGLENTTPIGTSFAIFANPSQRSIEDFVAMSHDGSISAGDFIGAVTVPANSEYLLVLSELPVGAYLIVAGFNPRTPSQIRDDNVVGLDVAS